VGERRAIRACAKAARLTNRDGTLEKIFRVQLPGKVIQRDDGPGKTLHSLNLQSYAYICIGSLEPSIHLHRCLANPDSTWTIGLRTRSGY
jgi:hypothetical protein